ncbi:MAG: PAS domain-containing protein [Chloroflexota bacterium]
MRISTQKLDELKQIAAGIQKLFGASCEVVIHDFGNLDHSIVHLEGNITGRTVGGVATDLLLACVRNDNTSRDMYNYRTQLASGRVMRSCTMFLRDETGYAYGAFCINFDISAFTQFHRYLENFVLMDTVDVNETFSDDVQGTVHSILLETVNEMGAELPILTREEKVRLIARLDRKGIFQVKRSVPILADELGLSRSTLYNYLSEARGERETTTSNNNSGANN